MGDCVRLCMSAQYVDVCVCKYTQAVSVRWLKHAGQGAEGRLDVNI